MALRTPRILDALPNRLAPQAKCATCAAAGPRTRRTLPSSFELTTAACTPPDLEFGQHLRRAGEQADLVDVPRRQFAHMLGDHRQLPGRHAEIVQDRARLEPAQPLAVAGREAPIAEAVGDLVEDAEKPVLAVGQRAVEVEQGEAVAHGVDRSIAVVVGLPVLTAGGAPSIPLRRCGIARRGPPTALKLRQIAASRRIWASPGGCVDSRMG